MSFSLNGDGLLLHDPTFRVNQGRAATMILEQIKNEATKPSNPFPFGNTHVNDTSGSIAKERSSVEGHL